MDAFEQPRRSCNTVQTLLRQVTVADAVVALLKGLGVRHAFGVSGAAMASLWRAMSMQLDTVHCRHDAGATFAAAEAYFATGGNGADSVSAHALSDDPF